MTVTRQQIIETAFALVEEGGAEAATMRRIAQALKIQPPSLYWHIAGRQALFDAMADHMLEGVGREIIAGEGWRKQLSRLAHELRDAMLAHRDGGRIFSGTYPLTSNIVRIAKPSLERLCEAGLARRQAVWALFSLVHFVIGSVIEQQAGPDEGSTATPPSAAADEAFASFAAEYPEIWQDDLTARFNFGLDVMLAGIAGQTTISSGAD